jgi:hypothetical protein
MLPSARKLMQKLNPNLALIQPMTQRAQFETTISSQLLFARPENLQLRRCFFATPLDLGIPAALSSTRVLSRPCVL